MYSPKVATYSVLITVAVGVHESRDVAKFDIPEEYLHTETDDNVIIFLEEALYYLVVKVAPKIYRKYFIMSSKGKPLLYAQMLRGLYGLLRSAQLLYREILKYLEAYGFHINPYDPCVVKKIINIKQMPVV